MGAEVAAHRGGRRLVEQREPGVDLAALHERAALAGERQHLPVAAPDLRRPLVGLVEQFHGTGEIATEQRSDRLEQRELGVLRRLRSVLEEPLGVREPAACDREGPARLVVPREHESEAGGAQPVVLGAVQGVRLLPVGDRLLELSAPPGRLSEQLVILAGERARVGLGVRGERGTPGLAAGGVACVLERVERLRHSASL